MLTVYNTKPNGQVDYDDGGVIPLAMLPSTDIHSSYMDGKVGLRYV